MLLDAQTNINLLRNSLPCFKACLRASNKYYMASSFALIGKAYIKPPGKLPSQFYNAGICVCFIKTLYNVHNPGTYFICPSISCFLYIECLLKEKDCFDKKLVQTRFTFSLKGNG